MAGGLSFCHSQAKVDRGLGGGEGGQFGAYDSTIHNPYTARLDAVTKLKHVK
jgi:hypothetical protein